MEIEVAQAGPLQTSKMESLATEINGFWSLTVFVKLSILDVCVGPDYTSAYLAVLLIIQ